MLSMIQTPPGQARDTFFEQVLNTDSDSVADAVLNQTTVGERSVDEVLTRLAELLGVGKTEALGILGISRSRKSKNPAMNVELLDRTYSALTLFARVTSVLGQEGARAWFVTPKKSLGGATPLNLLATRVGVGKLQDRLTALEDGTFL